MVTSLRAFRMEVALGKAINMSKKQPRETWRAMQLIATEGSVEGLPGNLSQTAIDFIDVRLRGESSQTRR